MLTIAERRIEETGQLLFQPAAPQSVIEQPFFMLYNHTQTQGVHHPSLCGCVCSLQLQHE
jgi:hypothetical protein